MLVASLALFLALSGTTLAVTALPKRSVGSAQLKKGAVRKENIANAAVTRSKLGSGLSPARASARAGRSSLRADSSYAVRAGFAENAGHTDVATFADKATTATTAASATSAGSAASVAAAADTDRLDGNDSGFFVAKSAVLEVPRFTLGNDESREMFTHGPFTLTARCYINQLARDDADILISTTQPHSAFHGFQQNPDLNPTSVEAARSLIGVDGLTGLPQYESSAYGTAAAPDGTEIRSMILYVGVNLFGRPPGRCTFGGVVIL
jgi:hypothetical protein